MAGTINLSLQQQFDSQGLPLGGGKLYCFQSGTSTPQSAYKDIALGIPHQNPVELDASGRVPQLFFADGTIKLRLTSRDGSVVVFEADFMPVLGASAGGSGGSSVDATTVLSTGDIKHRYGTGALSGFVRANGLTIGNAVSGATERANADCLALFQLLYANDANLTVSGGRSGNSLNDFNAGKTMALPDMRGRALAGMDDMGSTAANRIHTILASTTLGGAGGNQLYSIATANLPAHAHDVGTIATGSGGAHAHAFSGTTSTESANHTHAASVTDPGHVHNNTVASLSGFGGLGGGNAPAGGSLLSVANSISNASAVTGISVSNDIQSATHTHTYSGTTVSNGAHTHAMSGTTASTGAGTQMSIAQPTMAVTIYIKL